MIYLGQIVGTFCAARLPRQCTNNITSHISGNNSSCTLPHTRMCANCFWHECQSWARYENADTKLVFMPSARRGSFAAKYVRKLRTFRVNVFVVADISPHARSTPQREHLTTLPHAHTRHQSWNNKSRNSRAERPPTDITDVYTDCAFSEYTQQADDGDDRPCTHTHTQTLNSA